MRKISHQPTLCCQVSHNATSERPYLKCMHVYVYARVRRVKTREWYYFFDRYTAATAVRPALKRVSVVPHFTFQLFFYNFNTYTIIFLISKNVLSYAKIKWATEMLIYNKWFEINRCMNLIFYKYINYVHV